MEIIGLNPRVGPVRLSRFAGELCPYCRHRMLRGRGYVHPNAPSRDHIFPTIRGGWDVPYNIFVCCRSCNEKKGAHDPEEWAAVKAGIATSLQKWWTRSPSGTRGGRGIPTSSTLWHYWRKRLGGLPNFKRMINEGSL